jgi:hypothetical protein
MIFGPIRHHALLIYVAGSVVVGVVVFLALEVECVGYETRCEHDGKGGSDGGEHTRAALRATARLLLLDVEPDSVVRVCGHARAADNAADIL